MHHAHSHHRAGAALKQQQALCRKPLVCSWTWAAKQGQDTFDIASSTRFATPKQRTVLALLGNVPEHDCHQSVQLPSGVDRKPKKAMA